MTTCNLTAEEIIDEIKELAESWRIDSRDLKRNGLPEAAEQLAQLRDELLGIVRRARLPKKLVRETASQERT